MVLLIAPLVAVLAFAWAIVVRRRATLPAAITSVDPEAPTIDADGAARSVQAAELRIPSPALLALWSPASLERLARTYWRFLERSSLGLIRVAYSEHDRAVVLLCRPFVLIGFDPPAYELTAERGVVRWQIRGGALVLEARSPLAKCLGLFELEHMKCSFKTTRCQSPSEQCSKRCP